MTTDAASRPPFRFPVGLTVATAIALAILVGLGVWQVKRLAWKQALLAHVAALQKAPAQPLAPVLERLSGGGDADFTRVEVDCPGLPEAPFLELYGVRDARAGSRLISACAVNAGPYRAILVDRGFIADGAGSRPHISPASAAPFHLVGVLRRGDKPNFVTPKNDPQIGRWFSRDIPAMAKALKAPDPAPLFLMAETSTNPDLPALDPSPLPSEIPNRHFEYALTWFGLAAALACVYAASLWKRWKG